MGAIDKLLNMMKLNDDYDDYEDDFYNDDYEEPKPKRKTFAPKERKMTILMMTTKRQKL